MLVPVIALTMALGTLGVAQAASKTVKIGNIIPLSGPSASVGIQGKNAREMAVQEINDAGGIKSLGGAKLEMLYADSKSDPTAGVSAAEQMINSDKVVLLTGCWNSAVTYPTLFRFATPSPSAASKMCFASPLKIPGGPVISSLSSKIWKKNLVPK